MSRRRRAHYTRASDVTIKLVDTDEQIGRQRRYSPSELNAIRSARNPRRVRRIVENKRKLDDNAATRRYLELANTDN